MRRKVLSHLLCVLLFFSAGCASLSVNHDFDPQFDFASVKSYDWMPVPKKAKTDELTLKHIQYSVNNALQGKGLRMSSDNPDVLVAVHGGKERKVDVQEWGYGYANHDYYGGGYGGPYHGRRGPYLDSPRSDFEYRRGVDRYEYDVGTLVIDIVSADSKELIWRGTASGVIDPNAPSRDTIAHAVNKILERFPPNQPK
jgi:hypothetical protein